MGKALATSVLDASLIDIATCTEMYYCNGEPTSRADAIARRSANAIPLTGADFSAITGTTSRQMTVAAKSGTATASQNTDHIALCTGSALKVVTPAPAQTSNNGQPINSQAFTITSGPVS